METRTWCRSWWRGRRRAAGCLRAPRRGCRRRWRRRRRSPRRSTPTPSPAGTASRGPTHQRHSRTRCWVDFCFNTTEDNASACGSRGRGVPDFICPPAYRAEHEHEWTGFCGAHKSARELRCSGINFCRHAVSGMASFWRGGAVRSYPRNIESRPFATGFVVPNGGVRVQVLFF
jgi:hypothetical protein